MLLITRPLSVLLMTRFHHGHAGIVHRKVLHTSCAFNALPEHLQAQQHHAHKVEPNLQVYVYPILT